MVVGESAAFSPDGSQFAFSARPEDGSLGSDIYVWQVGEPEATRVTDDHRSVFAGWIGRLVLGSRAVDAVEIVGDPASSAGSGERSVGAQLEFRPEAFLVDPETREEVVLDLARVWRPAVDPTGKRAVYWDGTVRTTETGVDLETAGGRLVVGSWPDEPALPTDADAGPATPAAGTAVPPSAQPSAGDEGSLEVLADGPIRDWDARWNETGTHLAVWIADPDDPTKGRLSLYVVDRVTGRVDVEGALLRDEWALPGFAIGDGRLAWATPEGQDAESSLVKVLAWTDDGIGQVETAPGDEQVVVIR